MNNDTATRWIVGIFSLLVAAAGWYYMFYSRAAQKLAVVENAAINRRRVTLRRVGGTCMIAMAACFYISCEALIGRETRLFVGTFFAVLVLMAAILFLGLIDLRLTRDIRRRKP